MRLRMTSTPRQAVGRRPAPATPLRLAAGILRQCLVVLALQRRPAVQVAAPGSILSLQQTPHQGKPRRPRQQRNVPRRGIRRPMVIRRLQITRAPLSPIAARMQRTLHSPMTQYIAGRTQQPRPSRLPRDAPRSRHGKQQNVEHQKAPPLPQGRPLKDDRRRMEVSGVLHRSAWEGGYRLSKTSVLCFPWRIASTRLTRSWTKAAERI
mmetsp:Transcript_10402/g.18695  ORF Transcript_10402/g.18695 Transcript_10402/m.18695 type:complete len:208 (+) Transcript_10402:958-1581(+)